MKKLLVGVLFAGLCLGLSMYIQSTAHNAMAVSTQQYTCQPNGTFISPSTGPAAPTTEDLEASSRALAWLKNQQLTTSLITTSSSITPSQAYASTYTGPVTGTFSLQGVTYPVKSNALWNNCIYVTPQADSATPAQPVPQTSSQTTRQKIHRVQLGGSDISKDTADITAALEAQQQAPSSQVAPQFSQESNSSGAEPSRTDKPTQKTNWWAIGGMVTVAITLLIGTVATLLRRHDR